MLRVIQQPHAALVVEPGGLVDGSETQARRHCVEHAAAAQRHRVRASRLRRVLAEDRRPGVARRAPCGSNPRAASPLAEQAHGLDSAQLGEQRGEAPEEVLLHLEVEDRRRRRLGHLEDASGRPRSVPPGPGNEIKSAVHSRGLRPRTSPHSLSTRASPPTSRRFQSSKASPFCFSTTPSPQRSRTFKMRRSVGQSSSPCRRT